MSNNTIIQIFDYIADKLGVVIDWSQENLQPYLTDLFDRWVSYELAVAWGGIAICAVVAAIVIIYPIVVIKMCKKAKVQKRSNVFWEYWSTIGHTEYSGLAITITVILVILTIVIVVIVLFAGLIPGLIKLYTVPEIALYEMVFD